MSHFPNLHRLDGWPSTGSLKTAGTDIETAGKIYQEQTEDAQSHWSNVPTYYSSSGGDAVTLAGAFSLPVDRATGFAEAMSSAKSALHTWAGAIEGLKSRRTTAKNEAAGFPGNLEPEDPAYDLEIARINRLIDGVLEDYDQAASDCASSLDGITLPIANEHGDALAVGGMTAGYYESVLSLVYYEHRPPAAPTFTRREFLRGLPNLAMGLDPHGRPAQLDLPEPDFNRPYTLAADGVDVDGNRLEKPRGIRAAGGALAVVGAGFTFAGERAAAEERLLRENPHMDQETLENEVGQETLVRGGSSIATGLIIGATIGSVVPGAGTLVGAGIGLVAGTVVAGVMEFSGAQGWINDRVMDGFNAVVPENVQQGIGEAGDFVGDLVTGNWGELFD